MKTQSEPVIVLPVGANYPKKRPPQSKALPVELRSWVECCLVPNMVKAYIATHEESQKAVAQIEESVAQCPENVHQQRNGGKER
jgi:hypothetical protein